MNAYQSILTIACCSRDTERTELLYLVGAEGRELSPEGKQVGQRKTADDDDEDSEEGHHLLHGERDCSNQQLPHI